MAKTSKKSRSSKKRKSSNAAVVIIALVVLLVVVAGLAFYLVNKGDTYVYFDANYDGAVTTKQKITFGEDITYPTPTRDGYTFGGWYADEACTIPAETTIIDYILGQKLYAKWIPVLETGDLSVHFLELGNIYTGDCVYIKAGNVDILIDAGSRNNSAPTITKYLSEHVDDGKLEYVIATHAHQDHISGFYGEDGIFVKYKTETIIEFALASNKEPSENSVLGKYIAARQQEVAEGAKVYTAAQCFDQTDGAKREYQITDEISMEILYNYYYYNEASSENDYSVCLMIHQGSNNYLFTGDLESGGEKKMVEYYQNQNDPLPHCVLYKAGHHGSKTSSSAALMKAITPEYVCVCCCCGTSEYTDIDANQFPTQDFIDNVAPYTDKIYVTTMVDNYVDKWGSEGSVKPMNGNIVFTCADGVISINCSNNNTILKDTEWFKKHRTWPTE